MKLSAVIISYIGIAAAIPLPITELSRRAPAQAEHIPSFAEKFAAGLALPGPSLATGTFGSLWSATGASAGAAAGAGAASVGRVVGGAPSVGRVLGGGSVRAPDLGPGPVKPLRFPSTNPPGSAPHSNGGGGLAGNGPVGGGSIQRNVDAGALGRNVAPGAGLLPQDSISFGRLRFPLLRDSWFL
ncbi:hypothetical protein CDD81_7293 [Ophiocordyceps australis]|uniref:Uncharacterized protein n=1 Tax=Ophiocordyceps australis TaxID=1399860 RepID=A0A2C5XYG3_9HYPO|nr:hypothetical protein CDD81_7293 [Ophiocordyceps australis]